MYLRDFNPKLSYFPLFYRALAFGANTFPISCNLLFPQFKMLPPRAPLIEDCKEGISTFSSKLRIRETRFLDDAHSRDRVISVAQIWTRFFCLDKVAFWSRVDCIGVVMDERRMKTFGGVSHDRCDGRADSVRWMRIAPSRGTQKWNTNQGSETDRNHKLRRRPSAESRKEWGENE